MKGSRKEIEKNKREILRLYSQGETFSSISRHLNLDPHAISRFLKEIGSYEEREKSPSWKVLEPFKDEIIDLYKNQQFSKADIGRKFNINYKRVEEALKEWGAFVLRTEYTRNIHQIIEIEKEVIEKYLELKSRKSVEEFFNLNYKIVDKIIKRAGIQPFHVLNKGVRENLTIKILELSNEGKFPAEIAKIIGRGETMVLSTLTEAGIDTRSRAKRRLEDELPLFKDEMIALYEVDGWSVKEIGQKFGFSQSRISITLKSYGIEILNEKFRETSLERNLKELLIICGTKFEQHFTLNFRIYDFYLEDYNLIIEANGDYWHCNPKIYPAKAPIDDNQREGIRRDEVKTKLAKKAGYKILFIWESEVNHKKEKLLEILNNFKNEIPNQECPTDFLTDKI